uniref:Uncharacterized protein n=1 Tax=Romanomermis culicivorax TaxID=13658 RepID=A0A915IK55_ROMCU
GIDIFYEICSLYKYCVEPTFLLSLHLPFQSKWTIVNCRPPGMVGHTVQSARRQSAIYYGPPQSTVDQRIQ